MSDVLTAAERSVPAGEGDGLEPRMDLELREDVLNVGSDSVVADRQLPSDLVAAGAVAEKHEDVLFSRRQLPEQKFRSQVSRPRLRERLVGHDHLPLDHGLDRLDELGQGNILGHVACEPQSDSLPDCTGVVESGHRDDFGLRKVGEDSLTKLQPVHVRKSQIDENELRTSGGHDRHGFHPRADSVEITQSQVLQGGPDHLREQPVVIDDQDPNRTSTSLLRAPWFERC
jgi:hypothetical protein